MRKSAGIALPKGKLGVLTVGMGAVATTFMAGVDLVRRKKAFPVGSLTQLGTIRLGKRTEGRAPAINDFVPLEKLENIVFGGWDIFPDSAYEAAKNAAVLSSEHLAEVKRFLSKIKPMKAAFDQNYVKKLTGTHVKKGRNKYDLALQIRDDIQKFQKKNKVSRVVVIWCGSTEIFLKPHAVHETPESFVAAMKENHPSIAPSMLYAWAAITSGVPFANGAPNLTVDVPAIITLAKQHGVPICGKDFKTGQTLMKTILAPGFKARLLGMDGWFSTNILGNRDGEVLEDPESFKTKEESKARRVGIYPAAEPSCTRTLYAKIHHKVLGINYYPPRGDNKEGLGQHRYFRLARLPDADSRSIFCAAIPFLGAAPLVLDLVLFLDSGQTRRHARHSGMAGASTSNLPYVRSGALSRA